MQALTHPPPAAGTDGNAADVAIYHLSIKAVSRPEDAAPPRLPRTAPPCLIADERTGVVHDYQRRTGVAASFIVAPDAAAWAQDRAALWNAVEAAERRKDAKVAREYQSPCRTS